MLPDNYQSPAKLSEALYRALADAMPPGDNPRDSWMSHVASAMQATAWALVAKEEGPEQGDYITSVAMRELSVALNIIDTVDPDKDGDASEEVPDIGDSPDPDKFPIWKLAIQLIWKEGDAPIDTRTPVGRWLEHCLQAMWYGEIALRVGRECPSHAIAPLTLMEDALCSAAPYDEGPEGEDAPVEPVEAA